MFSQKKKKHTWIYACAVLIVAIFAVVVLIAALTGKESEEEALKANLESRVGEDVAKAADPGDSAPTLDDEKDNNDDNDDNDDVAGEDKDEPQNHEKDTPSQFYQSYYLIKYDKDVIKIFFSDETGHLIELEDTTIVYETLSTQDQNRFKEGIKVENRDDLNRLMMDYES